MPLSDDYQTERELKELADEVAHAITDAYVEMNCNNTRYFILFLLDSKTGTLNYISDMPKELADEAMLAHIKRNQQ